MIYPEYAFHQKPEMDKMKTFIRKRGMLQLGYKYFTPLGFSTTL
jgi:hypothetical protein